MESITETLKRLGAARIALMAAVAVGLLGLIAYMSLSMSTPNMTPLYTGLNATDSAQIMTQLQTMGVPYETKDGGTQIAVPADQVLALRVRLSGQGMPSGGSVIGYEIFDRSEGLGTSNFVYNVNYVRALEGELARTIGAFSGIEGARVHLVIPKRELFAQNKAFPTASVAVTMLGANRLKKEEIGSIRHLVATAVPGLLPGRITIVDNNGRLLARGGSDEDDTGSDIEAGDEYRATVEARLRKSIEGLIEESLGIGRVKAEVTADLDLDKIVTTSERYDPDGQVARSVQSTSENEKSSEKSEDDTVSVENNLPDANAGAASGAATSSSTDRVDEVTNFEISKTVENHIQEVGSIKKLSVAVLVDGSYKTKEDGAREYIPLSADEIVQIDKLVKSAIGYDEKRGDKVEVVNMQFSSQMENVEAPSALDWLKQDLPKVLQTAIFGIVAILAILMVVRPLVNRMLEMPSRDEEDEEGLSGPAIAGHVSEEAARAAEAAMAAAEEDEVLIDVDRIKGKVKSSSIKRISSLVEEHPEETISVIRQWING